MRTINQKSEHEISQCVDKFRVLITNEVTVSDLFTCIDDVIYNYTIHAIDNSGCCIPDKLSDQLYYLKRIRDLLLTKDSKTSKLMDSF